MSIAAATQCVALEAELLACKEGINLALQWTLLPIIVVADCLVALSMIRMQRRRRQPGAEPGF
uniref:RNase H type-1 domain-containing protein n=1 Tax=Oryza meridionalis TaxID=40149 RepID=A0A0E0BWT5_9ORYZ